MVDDLVKAGLNPMLAVGGMQGSAGGVVGASSNPIDTSGINSAKAQKSQIRIAEMNAKTDLLRAEAESRLAHSRADTEDYMRSLNGELVNAQTLKLGTDMNVNVMRLNMDFQDLLMRKEVHGYEVQQILSQIKHLASMSNLNESQAKQIMLDVNSIDKQIHREWVSTVPGRDLYKVADIVKTLFGMIGTVGVFTGKIPGRVGVGN